MKKDDLRQAGCFLFDMDGTVYLGEQLLPGAKQLFDWLQQNRIPYYFITNNSSRARQQYAAKLEKLGLRVPESLIFTSGEATAIYLQMLQPSARLFVVGTPSLEEEMRQHGFELVQEQPDFVVLGFDTTLTYEKIRQLCDFVRAGVRYIATHPDINCPTEDGYMPDIGAMMAMIVASTGKQPDVVVGKPNAPIVQAVLHKTGVEAAKMIMVGDRLYTDIALGQAGITTILVLSGESSLADVAQSPHQPDFIAKDLSEILAWLQDSPSN